MYAFVDFCSILLTSSLDKIFRLSVTNKKFTVIILVFRGSCFVIHSYNKS